MCGRTLATKVGTSLHRARDWGMTPKKHAIAHGVFFFHYFAKAGDETKVVRLSRDLHHVLARLSHHGNVNALQGGLRDDRAYSDGVRLESKKIVWQLSPGERLATWIGTDWKRHGSQRGQLFVYFVKFGHRASG